MGSKNIYTGKSKILSMESIFIMFVKIYFKNFWGSFWIFLELLFMRKGLINKINKLNDLNDLSIKQNYYINYVSSICEMELWNTKSDNIFTS